LKGDRKRDPPREPPIQSEKDQEEGSDGVSNKKVRGGKGGNSQSYVSLGKKDQGGPWTPVPLLGPG